MLAIAKTAAITDIPGAAPATAAGSISTAEALAIEGTPATADVPQETSATENIRVATSPVGIDSTSFRLLYLSHPKTNFSEFSVLRITVFDRSR